jgi:hypothetical protein
MEVMHGASRDRWFLATVVAVLLVLPFVPWALARSSVPAGFRHGGLLNPGQDFNLYYSFVRQAREGRWTFANLHTTDPHPPALVNAQWLAVGLVGRLTGWSDAVLDHLWRMAGATLLFVSFWHLLGRFVRGRGPRRVAFLTFAAGGGLGGLFLLLDHLGVTFRWDYPYAAGGARRTPFDVFAALPFHTTFQSFHVASFGLLIAAVVLFVRGEERGRLRDHVGAGLLGLTLALSHPYEAITLAATAGLYVLIGRVRWRAFTAAPTRGALVVLGLTALGLAYWPILYAAAPAFRWFLAFPPTSPLHTLAAFGAVGVLAIAGAPAFFCRARAGERAVAVVACLLLANVGLYYAYPLLDHAGAYRTTLMAPLVIVALARLDAWWPRLTALRGAGALLAAALLVNALSPAVGFAARVREATAGAPSRLYLAEGLGETLDWLARNTARTDAVLTPPGLGHWAPARAGNVVYLGALGLSGAAAAREREVRRFYANEADVAWLASTRVRYVLVTPEASGFRATPGLEPRFSAADYTLYEVGPGAQARTRR